MRSLPIDSLVSFVFIFQGLFLGSIGAANNKEELKNLNITHILTVANSFEPSYPNDFVYKIINGKNVVSDYMSLRFLKYPPLFGTIYFNLFSLELIVSYTVFNLHPIICFV